MTAVLASIGPWGWVCSVLGSSLIFALLIGGMIRRADETERAQYPPPVPAPRPRESDLDWLFDQPDEVWLTVPVVRDRCRQIEIAEGWASK